MLGAVRIRHGLHEYCSSYCMIRGYPSPDSFSLPPPRAPPRRKRGWLARLPPRPRLSPQLLLVAIALRHPGPLPAAGLFLVFGTGVPISLSFDGGSCRATCQTIDPTAATKLSRSRAFYNVQQPNFIPRQQLCTKRKYKYRWRRAHAVTKRIVHTIAKSYCL